MRFAGIDIGSRAIKLVVIEDGIIVNRGICDAGFDPLKQTEDILCNAKFDRLMATGYGRHLLEISKNVPTITEIKACGIGSCYFYPDVKTIIDIGGQDCKIISLDDNGKIWKFEMNDRCAAGTGRFLEVMAKTLHYSIDEFSHEALNASGEIKISSMCTVFGETEVISLLARGEDRQKIALGLHKSVVNRVLSMLKRISMEEPIILTGGVAHNTCIVELLRNAAGKEIKIPENPQFVGALGAAIVVSKKE
jgi:(R)-2-hydroxyacyl-CoA dehydratese activating ATPase